MLIRSMRFRLTVLFALMFGGAQAALWLIVDKVRSGHVLAEFDRQLIVRAHDMLELIGHLDDGQPRQKLAERCSDILRPFEARGFFFQVRTADGASIARSSQLTGFDLPFQACEGHPNDNDAAGPSLRTIRCKWNDPLVTTGGRLRLVTLCPTSAAGRLCLQAAINMEPVLKGIAESRRLVVVFSCVSLLLAVLATWFITGRSLAPLHDLSQTAKRVSAAHLEVRSDAGQGGDEISSAIEAVNDMLDRLEREFHRLERFVANISHELKTPLVVLLGEAQRLRRERGNAQQRDEFVTTVEQETRKLLRSIEAFLILARAQARVRLPATAEVSLEEVVLSAIETCRLIAKEKGVRILPHFDAAEGAGEPHVAGDADLLRSMLHNLLQNAIRHSPAKHAVEVHITCSAGEARLAVRDRGPGIPEERLASIFDRFNQFDTGGKRMGAAGLGLAIVKAVAELHGGSVRARNLPDTGCEFCVTLPLVRHGG